MTQEKYFANEGGGGLLPPKDGNNSPKKKHRKKKKMIVTTGGKRCAVSTKRVWRFREKKRKFHLGRNRITSMIKVRL